MVNGAFKLTENILRSLCTEQSFERGKQYYHAGVIYNAIRQGNVLTAFCEGSSAPAYRLRVELDQAGVRSASCTCPYDWGGLCKHLVALLLTYIHQPETFTERGSLADLLAGLERDDLVALIEKLAFRDPDLYDWLETTVTELGTKKTAASQEVHADRASKTEKRQTMVSEQAYRRQVKNILRSLDGLSSSQAYWGVSGMVEQLEEVRHSAIQFLDAGDPQGAITILLVLLQEVADEYEIFDDSDGELGDFLDSLGLPLAEAILSVEMDADERSKLEGKVEQIWGYLSDYGIDGLEVAAAALKHGWTNIKSSLDEEEGWQEEDLDEDDDWDGYIIDELLTARLNVLECQGRTDEYLDLCLHSGEYLRYVVKLLELNRIDEAIPVAMDRLENAEDALLIAQRLRDLDHIQDALRVAERGFSLGGHKYDLGCWLGSIQEAQGNVDQAILAYRAAFNELPSVELYQTLKRLSVLEWETIQPQLMDILRSSANTHVLADVYLLEEKWDAAIRLADQSAWDYRLVQKVAEAIIAHRPDWVIQASRKQAESLIERTQSKYYPHAARWLALMKRAYIQKGKLAEWEAYLSSLKGTYARRPALQAELKRL
jgi:uncharacterized Zn finger protein